MSVVVVMMVVVVVVVVAVVVVVVVVVVSDQGQFQTQRSRDSSKNVPAAQDLSIEKISFLLLFVITAWTCFNVLSTLDSLNE